MKHWVLGLSMALLIPQVAVADVLDRVVVVVNDSIVTSKDVERAFFPLKQQLSQSLQGEELRAKLSEARKAVLEKIINQELMYQEALEKGIKIKSADIDQAIEDIKVQFPSEAKFLEVLDVQGISLKAFRDNVKKQMYSKRYRQYFVLQDIRVFASEMNEFYEANKNKYLDPVEVRASQIFIPFSLESDKAFARKKAEQVLTSLKSGESFEDLARQFSKGPNADKGGDLGFLKSGQMIKEVEDALKAMYIGDISPIVESSAGLHILKLTARKQPRQLPLAEVEEQVRQQVYALKADQKYQEDLVRLRDKAFIEYKAELS